MTGVLHPARVRRPSNEWLPASDDRNRAHRVACRPYASEHGKVQYECRLNYRLMSNGDPETFPLQMRNGVRAAAMRIKAALFPLTGRLGYPLAARPFVACKA